MAFRGQSFLFYFHGAQTSKKSSNCEGTLNYILHWKIDQSFNVKCSF